MPGCLDGEAIRVSGAKEAEGRPWPPPPGCPQSLLDTVQDGLTHFCGCRRVALTQRDKQGYVWVGEAGGYCWQPAHGGILPGFPCSLPTVLPGAKVSVQLLTSCPNPATLASLRTSLLEAQSEGEKD